MADLYAGGLGCQPVGPNKAPSPDGRRLVLGEHVLDCVRSGGYRSVQFNAVVETNYAAVHLWQALGFQILTTIPEAFNDAEHGLVGLHVMFHPLEPQPGADDRSPRTATVR